jgi:hypothetical protein
MSETDLYDDDDDDREEIDVDDDFETVIPTAADRKRNSLETRRRIEQMMELKRLRELDETIGLEDLEW